VIEKEKSLARFYKNSLKRGKDYIPTFKYMLRDDGLSDLFIYMSMVESGFNPNAISSKKAVGIWQFMPSTARHYNLSVNKYIDERYNPISSTTAAIKYLKKLKKDFGKWYLAIMAYNCGERRVAKAIKKAGSDDIVVLLDKNQKYIPKETRDYVKKILLLSMIGENNPNNLDIPLAFKSKENTIINYDDEGTAEVFVKRGTNLSILAQIIGVDKKQDLYKVAVIQKNTTYKLESDKDEIIASQSGQEQAWVKVYRYNHLKLCCYLILLIYHHYLHHWKN